MNNKPGSLKKFFKNLNDYAVNILISSLPHFSLFNAIKASAMRMRGAVVGKRIKLLSGIWIDDFSSLEIKDDVSLARGVILVAAGGIKIGHRTMIGYGSKIISTDHIVPPGKESPRFSGLKYKEVIIGDDVWIGAGAIILPGITIGDGAVIGAGSVVTRPINSYAVMAGTPAKLIRMRA